MKIILGLILTLTLLASTTYATNPVVTVVQNPVVIKRHVVEFDANTFLGLQGYYGTQDKLSLEIAKQNSTDKQAVQDLAIALRKAIEFIESSKNSGTTAPITQPTPTSVPQPESPKVDNLDQAAYNIFRANCATCHSDNKASGGLKLVSSNGLYDLPALTRFNIYFRTAGVNLKQFNRDQMPLSGKALSDSDVSVLFDWATKGMLKETKK